MASMMRRRKRVRLPNEPPYGPLRPAGAQQLVTEISVALLDVHELKARVAGQPRGRREILDEPVEIVVFEHAHALWKASIKRGMVPRRQRLGTVVRVGPRVPPRMRKLQTDVEIVGRPRAEPCPMRAHELVAKRRDRALGLGREHQLMRVGAAVVSHGHGFAPPDQLRAAHAEVSPPPPRQIARLASGRAVPPLHRQNAEAIADPYGARRDRLRQRRFTARQFIVEIERDSARHEVRSERRRRLERCNPRVRRVRHRPSPESLIPSPTRRRRPGNGGRDATPHGSRCCNRAALAGDSVPG